MDQVKRGPRTPAEAINKCVKKRKEGRPPKNLSKQFDYVKDAAVDANGTGNVTGTAATDTVIDTDPNIVANVGDHTYISSNQEHDHSDHSDHVYSAAAPVQGAGAVYT